ncbi:metal-binding protein [Geitlerinema sp. PCC 9228]|jgi:uncharacterized metal-binding protein|uniref:metal-binding protein n=1 Tax=Geitlerinema sp. PCC 9228 TaxID=111611 RepID=UPI0008F98F09|nr:metal-binding protein [Geitlerinema sp. PCC 9228]
MPSGRTHDRITLWSLPVLASITFVRTGSSSITLLVSGGFLFGGLMFGPDLDIRSRQYQRWGWGRWIWIPYQRSLRHRAFLSHGPIVGTLGRLLYFGVWLATIVLVAIFIWAIAWDIFGQTDSWQLSFQQVLTSSLQTIQRSLQQHPHQWLAVLVGLELGAMSHSLSDWSGSLYKRVQKKGWRSILPAKSPAAKKKRRSSKSPKSRQRIASKSNSRKNG